MLVTFVLSIIAATIAGCQTSSERPAEGNHTCIVTPADLVECELAEDTETGGLGAKLTV